MRVRVTNDVERIVVCRHNCLALSISDLNFTVKDMDDGGQSNNAREYIQQIDFLQCLPSYPSRAGPCSRLTHCVLSQVQQ
jgi:hypothetical protein